MPDVTPNLGLILSDYNDAEHRDDNTNWLLIDASSVVHTFAGLQGGTNTTAAMVVGTGGSLSFSGTGTVDANKLQAVVISATPPSTGQVLTATSATGANWQTPSGGGAVSSVFGRTGAVVAVSGDYSVGLVTGAAPLASPAFTGTPTAPTAAPGTNTTQIATTAFVLANAGTSKLQTKRLNIGSLTTAQVSGPNAVTFTTPFADGNYTVQVSVTCGEAPQTPTVAAFPSVGIQEVTYQATPGNGVNVWVANNDSGTHTNVTIQVTAWHD